MVTSPKLITTSLWLLLLPLGRVSFLSNPTLMWIVPFNWKPHQASSKFLLSRSGLRSLQQSITILVPNFHGCTAIRIFGAGLSELRLEIR